MFFLSDKFRAHHRDRYRFTRQYHMQENSELNDYQRNVDLWENGLQHLRRELDPQVYTAYIAPLKLRSFDPSCAKLTVAGPSRLVCNHVDKNFKERISGLLCSSLGVDNLDIRFEVAAPVSENGAAGKSRPQYVVVKNTPSAKTVAQAAEAKLRDAEPCVSNLNPRYTFSNFVVGNSNQFCHAAALRVAEMPGQSYNPLFIYGGVGLGKTHLMHAIGNAVTERSPNARVLYLSSETFTNDLIQALRFDKMNQFKIRLRGIEVLLIDDIQFICNKERTQEEFFHTFNALYGSKRQIVISSDKIPHEIHGLEERLKTRFAWGLTADIQAPDFETRVAILKRKAALESVFLPEDVAHFVAEKISSNVRELEGALTRVHAISSLQAAPITLELTQHALKPFLTPKVLHISVRDIKRVVAEFFSIKVSEMISKRRTKNLSFPRHIAMFLCRKHTTCSYPEIGFEFGGRDHSSVIHAAQVVSEKVKADLELRGTIAELERRLLGG